MATTQLLAVAVGGGHKTRPGAVAPGLGGWGREGISRLGPGPARWVSAGTPRKTAVGPLVFQGRPPWNRLSCRQRTRLRRVSCDHLRRTAQASGSNAGPVLELADWTWRRRERGVSVDTGSVVLDVAVVMRRCRGGPARRHGNTVAGPECPLFWARCGDERQMALAGPCGWAGGTIPPHGRLDRQRDDRLGWGRWKLRLGNGRPLRS